MTSPRERAEAAADKYLRSLGEPFEIKPLADIIEAAIIADRREQASIPKAVSRETLQTAIEGADNGDGTFDLAVFERSLTSMLEEHWQAAQIETRRELLAGDGATIEAMTAASLHVIDKIDNDCMTAGICTMMPCNCLSKVMTAGIAALRHLRGVES